MEGDVLNSEFPLKITRYYRDLINWEDPLDPLARQVVPLPDECRMDGTEKTDPLDEARYSPVPGLIHKYPGRVLVLITRNCAVHCRFCFRKSSLLRANDPEEGLSPEMQAYIRGDPSIREVILSGGDPLVLDNGVLRTAITELVSIPHVSLIRIHTRIPAVNPKRIDADLVNILKLPPALWLVTHFNHPREVTHQAIQACNRIIDAGIPVLNQTVLLNGVNNRIDILELLFLRLIENRIQPYYLHILDPAPGTAHFRVPVKEARELMRDLRGKLPGYAVPRLVKDEPGMSGKTILETESN